MKAFILALIAMLLLPPALAGERLLLGNDAWPPFVLEGAEEGTVERLICMALERSGWECAIEVDDWPAVLESARSGTIDGIAATWHSRERESYLLYSEPYLTNRIVPVVRSGEHAGVDSVGGLAGLRVARISGYAYGDDIDRAEAGFESVETSSALMALYAVQDGLADVALLDELVARAELEDPNLAGLEALDSVLAFRSLHLAISRERRDARAVLADFHRAYQMMLSEGLVNEILDVDWLATDFGHSGRVDLVLRSGSDLSKVSHPSRAGSVYALEDSEYRVVREGDLDDSRVQYQVEGKSYSSLQSALENVFGDKVVCEHKEFSSEFDCSKLFQKR